MRVRVKVFATLSRHLSGVMPGAQFEAEVPDGTTVEDLVERLSLPREEVKVVYVNGRARPSSYALNPGDDVGIFPPIGGG
jgi:molybdopterin converting factor small subunit